MSSSELANTLHDTGSNCCQAVLGSCCQRFRLDRETAYRLGAFFGRGMRRGEVCGAVTGALMGLGLCYGDENNRSCHKSAEFIKAFREAHGSILCRELLNADGSNKAQLCPRLICWAAEYLEREFDAQEAVSHG